jgi:hypothetical protein
LSILTYLLFDKRLSKHARVFIRTSGLKDVSKKKRWGNYIDGKAVFYLTPTARPSVSPPQPLTYFRKSYRKVPAEIHRTLRLAAFWQRMATIDVGLIQELQLKSIESLSAPFCYPGKSKILIKYYGGARPMTDTTHLYTIERSWLVAVTVNQFFTTFQSEKSKQRQCDALRDFICRVSTAIPRIRHRFLSS